MEAGLVEQLLDFGALGIFAGFLIWQFVGLQKRLDKLVADFQSQLKEINDDYDDRIDKMRERYDGVIKQARDETNEQAKEFMSARVSVQQQIVSKLDSILATVQK